jgi:hypothetical protein
LALLQLHSPTRNKNGVAMFKKGDLIRYIADKDVLDDFAIILTKEYDQDKGKIYRVYDLRKQNHDWFSQSFIEDKEYWEVCYAK